MQQPSIFLGVVGILASLLSDQAAAQAPRLRPAPVLDRDASRRDDLVPVVPRPTSSAITPIVSSASATLGQPDFDAYSTSPDAASSPPTLFGTPSNPALNGSSIPYAGSAPGYDGLGTPFPATAYPQQPPMLFPSGPPALFPNGLQFSQVNGWPQAQPGPYMRLFQDVRFRYTWVGGETGPRELDTNDVEVATTVNFPNFLWSGRPVQVSPVFVFHFWDGPDTTAGSFPTTLPSRVYSTFLQSAWQPMLTPMFGGDIDVTIGVFSDFGKINGDSVRVFGTGVFVLALTPTLAVKGGINYLDRVDLKLLPAAGIVWTPNPQTRFDIFFPKPKLAQYLTTIGNTDVWWYVNGEYGGGSWTVDRIPMAVDDRRVDINDIRVGGGLEWTGYGGIRGFVEAAYVFDRELVFASGSGPPPVSLKDSVMVRGGLAY